jgi:hypothetical protein
VEIIWQVLHPHIALTWALKKIDPPTFLTQKMLIAASRREGAHPSNWNIKRSSAWMPTTRLVPTLKYPRPSLHQLRRLAEPSSRSREKELKKRQKRRKKSTGKGALRRAFRL